MTREQREALVALLPPGRVLLAEPTANQSAAGVGGPVDAFVRAEAAEELRAVMAFASENGIDYRFWGTGSAQLVRDGGLAGILIALGSAFGSIKIVQRDDAGAQVAVGAAARPSALEELCEAQGLAGAAALGGRRGTLGGALCASGFAQDEALLELTILTKEGRELTLTRQAMRFEEGRLRIPRTAAILRALLALRPRAPMAEAAAKAPGAERCFRPVFADAGRTPAETLIEDAGLAGVRVGGARVATEHANAILNEGKASARDVAVLVSLMRDRVRESSGVTLEPVIELIGER
jgi:UDP-N-acetylmuramate dehydrogenase